MSGRAKATVDLIWVCVQIAAAILAGIWTYEKFIRTEEPSFELTVGVSTGVRFERVEPGSCLAIARVSISNQGKSTFDVTAIGVRGWRAAVNLEPGRSATFFDEQALAKTTPAFEVPKGPSEVLNYRYGPGSGAYGDFTWAVPNTPRELIYVVAEVDLVDSDKRPHTKKAYGWAQTCFVPSQAR